MVRARTCLQPRPRGSPGHGFCPRVTSHVTEPVARDNPGHHTGVRLPPRLRRWLMRPRPNWQGAGVSWCRLWPLRFRNSFSLETVEGGRRVRTPDLSRVPGRGARTRPPSGSSFRRHRGGACLGVAAVLEAWPGAPTGGAESGQRDAEEGAGLAGRHREGVAPGLRGYTRGPVSARVSAHRR